MRPADAGGPLEAVCFGSYDVGRHPRVAVLRDGLRANGVEVHEVNEPLGLSTADKVGAASSLPGALGFVRRVGVAWWRMLRRGRADVRRPDVVLVGYLGHLDVHLARLLWPRSVIVLDHLVGLSDTVRDRQVGSRVARVVLGAVDRAALAQADVVVVDTEEQRDQLPRAVRRRSVVVPVGATEDWFDVGPAPSGPPWRVCFVGLFTPLHGAPVIGAAMRELRDDDRFEFTMIGTGQDWSVTAEVAGDARVEWVDWVASEDLPTVVGSHHVALGIFGTTPKAFRVVPTKVFQSMAAGAVVVTSDTGAQRRVLGPLAEYVPPGDPLALAERLRSLAEGRLVSGADRADSSRFRPAQVVEPLMRALREPGVARRLPVSSR